MTNSVVANCAGYEVFTWPSYYYFVMV